MPNDPKPPLRRPGVGGAKAVPGPTLHAGGTMPCGCKVANDPEDNKLRYWFCPPHAVAYEMLEVLQEGQHILDEIMNHVDDDYDTTKAMEAGIKIRKVLKRAKGDWR